MADGTAKSFKTTKCKKTPDIHQDVRGNGLYGLVHHHIADRVGKEVKVFGGKGMEHTGHDGQLSVGEGFNGPFGIADRNIDIGIAVNDVHRPSYLGISA